MNRILCSSLALLGGLLASCQNLPKHDRTAEDRPGGFSLPRLSGFPKHDRTADDRFGWKRGTAAQTEVPRQVPVDPAFEGNAPAVPLRAPDNLLPPVAADPEIVAEPEPVAPFVEAPVVVTPTDLAGFVGMGKWEAIALVRGENRPWRIRSEDGNHFPATADFVQNRVNFVIKRGRIVAATKG